MWGRFSQDWSKCWRELIDTDSEWNTCPSQSFRMRMSWFWLHQFPVNINEPQFQRAYNNGVLRLSYSQPPKLEKNIYIPLTFRIQLCVKMPMYDIIWHHNYFGSHTYSYEISTGPSRPHRIFPMEIPHRPNAISFNTMMAGSPTDLEGNNCMSKL